MHRFVETRNDTDFLVVVRYEYKIMQFLMLD